MRYETRKDYRKAKKFEYRPDQIGGMRERIEKVIGRDLLPFETEVLDLIITPQYTYQREEDLQESFNALVVHAKRETEIFDRVASEAGIYLRLTELEDQGVEPQTVWSVSCSNACQVEGEFSAISCECDADKASRAMAEAEPKAVYAIWTGTGWVLAKRAVKSADLETALDEIAEMGDGTYCITSTGTVFPYGHDEIAKVCGGRYIVGEWCDVRSSAEASKRISESGKHLPLVVGYWEGEYDLPYGYDDREEAIHTARHFNQKAIFDTVEGVCFDA